MAGDWHWMKVGDQCKQTNPTLQLGQLLVYDTTGLELVLRMYPSEKYWIDQKRKKVSTLT